MEREGQIDRIDAALAELRRLGRPRRGGHHGHHSHRGHNEHGDQPAGHERRPGSAGHRGHARERRMVGMARHRMLSVLAERPGLGVTELAEAIGVDQPRASRLVNDAAESGLIRRRPDPLDGRRSVVELTAAGREHLESTRRERRATVEAGVTGFSAAETATLADLLERFAAGIRDDPAAPDPSATK